MYTAQCTVVFSKLLIEERITLSRCCENKCPEKAGLFVYLSSNCEVAEFDLCYNDS